MPRVMLSGLFALLCAAFVAPLHAATPHDAELTALVDALGSGDFEATTQAVKALAASGDPRAARVLGALSEGRLLSVQPGGGVVLARPDGAHVHPMTEAPIALSASATLEKIKVNNRLRREIAAVVGGLTLMSPDAAQRLKAAEAVLKSRDPAMLPLLDQALKVEPEAAIRAVMSRARATTLLVSDGPEADKLAAVALVAAQGDRDALSLLASLAAVPGPVAAAARKAAGQLESRIALWSVAQNVVYGLSLGSVLLLAATGLAITFGVMGVINMAHGEMVMIGAYTTYVVQEVIRSAAPAWTDWALPIALPAAFIVTAAIGMAIERSMIRWLYGRPLETLLATWGISLALQQAVRVLFGASNQEVGNPAWMSGSIDVGLLTITAARLWIIVFSLAVFGVLLVLIKRSLFGLQMRAVMQHRPMASSMGIRTPRVDMLTFGLGSGLAGLAGVALSQIDNVSPNLGRGYIIDSFMVVVFGGVGNLWGTLIGAFTLGITNKLLEPHAGAVLGKIALLVFIILFIQKRPRGLFALKGRMVEA
ncbi:MAG: urea ABC transporter permease subunit UrtB [Pseudomonadota bacterium]